MVLDLKSQKMCFYDWLESAISIFLNWRDDSLNAIDELSKVITFVGLNPKLLTFL